MRSGISRVWQKALAWSTLHVPRRFYYPIMLLRMLIVIPGVIGVIHNTHAAWYVSERDAGGAIALQSTQADYIVANLWCGLAGYWCWIATTSILRRWLHHYEVGNAIVRLMTLTVIIWSVSAYVDSKHSAHQPVQCWMIKSFILLVTNIIRLCIASQARYRRTPINLTSTVVKALVLPLSAVTCLTVFVALQLMDQLQYTTSQLMTHQSFKLDTVVTHPSGESLLAVVLIMSSWSHESFLRRQTLRQTSLRLLADDVVYRFVVGKPPTAHVQMMTGPHLVQESDTYHDLLVVPTSDLSKSKGRKVFEAMRWSHGLTYDYLLKSDDDVFVRWDVVLSELRAIGPRTLYWKGLTLRNMEDTSLDYSLQTLPPYTSGALFVLSHDVIQLATQTGTPRRFVAGDDGRNVAIWLFGFHIHPIHDKRFHHGEACKDDLISRRVKHAHLQEMDRMYHNVIQGVSQCAGGVSGQCAPCYPCQDWREDPNMAELHCDPVKGISPRTPKANILSLSTAAADRTGTAWIPEHDLFAEYGSESSSLEDEHWYLLYWVAWITDGSSRLADHQQRVLESILIHTPNAVLFLLSNAPSATTDELVKAYLDRGYKIRVVHVDADTLLQRQWYLGPNTHDWLQDYRTWEYGPHFTLHLTDYLASVLLYKYGGTFMDLDRLWVHLPSKETQFMATEGDLHTLSRSLTRVKRGWPRIRKMAENAFSRSTYDPACLGCHAIHSHLNGQRDELVKAGVAVLPNEIRYPASYHKAHQLLLQRRPPFESMDAAMLLVDHWRVHHLAGMITSHLPAEFGKMLDPLFGRFDLGVWQPQMTLVGPHVYEYIRGQPGAFQGIYTIYIRGGPTRDRRSLHCKVSSGTIQVNGEAAASSWSMAWSTLTQKDINQILSTLIYSPPSDPLIHQAQLWVRIHGDKEHTIMIPIMIA